MKTPKRLLITFIALSALFAAFFFIDWNVELVAWVVCYALDVVLWLWVIRFGGAHWLFESFISGLLIHVRAPRWSEDGIRIYVWGLFVVHTLLFIVGVFDPNTRDFLYFWR